MARSNLPRANRILILSKSQAYRPNKAYLVPVLLISAGLIFVVVVSRYLIPNRDDQISLLRTELTQKLLGSDLDGAIERLEKLEVLSPDNQLFSFQRASVEEARGNMEVARELFTRLVERENPDAAFWELEQDFKEQYYGDWEESKHHRFKKLVTLASNSGHLETAKRSKEYLAAYQLHHKEFEKALAALHDATLIDPSVGLSAAVVAKQLGQLDRAHEYLTKAKFHFAGNVQRNPQDERIRLQLARAHLLLEEEADAVRQLSEGFLLSKNAIFRQAAGEAMIMWASRIEKESPFAVAVLQRVKLIQRASQCAPHDPLVLNALANILHELRQYPDQYLPQLQSAMAQGFDHESAHFMLGILNMLEGNQKEARFHCDLAEAAGSHIATVLNNLALVALDHQNISKTDALLLIDGAMERLPEQPQFRETRGRVLIALGRYQEAIGDLKEALVLETLQPKVYHNLSIAYAALGNEAEALHYKNCSVSQ